MMVNPKIAIVVTGFGRGALCGGKEAWVASLHLVGADAITRLSVMLIYWTIFPSVGPLVSFAKLTGKT
jgi:hypothetical protein